MKKSISGIRGVFGGGGGGDFELGHVIEFVGNFSRLIGEGGACVIGRDTRPSGPVVEEVAVAALLQNGVDVYTLGVAPTPVVFREARRRGAGGVVVSSSHNPLDWNGLKFIVGGRGINEDELKTVVSGSGGRGISGSVGEQTYIESEYIHDALEQIGPVAGLRMPGVTVDAGGGAAAGTAPDLLERLGCKVDVINGSVSGSTRGPDPTGDALADLVRASACRDIGFAFDLDGDRLVVVKDGVKQAPDVTLGLGVARSLELGHRKFVFSVDTSVSIERFVRERGGSVQRSKVGEANVIDAMLKAGADAGGEGSSGGFILPEFNYCRDGILTSGLVAAMLGDRGDGRLAEIMEFMGGYCGVRDVVAVESDLHDAVMAELEKEVRSGFSETVTIDGIKGIADEDSWVLVRKSNTEDIIRVSAESDDPQKARRMVEDARRMVVRCHERVG